MRYRGEKTREISFPLGGIGSGSIGLAGNGALVDWEIFNKPNKGSHLGFSHFAVKAEAGGKLLDARALVGDAHPPYTGSATSGGTSWQSFGFGIRRTSLQGLPHFRSTEFVGEFPFATVEFNDRQFPGRVRLHAFNPFIPLNDRDSSIPAACFVVEIENPTARKIRYTIAGTLLNPHAEQAVNRFAKKAGAKLIRLSSPKWKPDDLEFGDMTIATDASQTSHQETWFVGHWFDNLEVYWRDFARIGPLPARRCAKPVEGGNEAKAGHTTLAARIEVGPRQTKQVRFVIAWHFPNVSNYWQPPTCDEKKCPTNRWKNYYASLFKDSTDAAGYVLKHWDRLHSRTQSFKNALFGSTLPDYVLDAVSANISILKSPTVLRLEDGSLYGFEGCCPTCGCCEGSCQHVWNYAYALPFLFPNLERSMRELEYTHSMRDDGKLGFRLRLPLGRARQDFACADGQFGTIIKCYREWKMSGDDAWLRKWWPSIRKSLEFAWATTNEHLWDADRDGVLEGRQHHTLDVELFGPNSWLTGFYLAALKAAAEMAEHLGEPGKAKEYRELFAQGKTWVDKNLFNGEFYHQKVDLADRSILKPFTKFESAEQRRSPQSVQNYYWDAEHRQLKYQVADGCQCDQVLAQWHANLVGLGEIFNPRQVKKALRAIYRHNFKKSMRDEFNPCRLYALNDEPALVICDWPRGGKPAVPIPYAEEAMNGFEYQAGIHMIQEGLVDEGLQVIRAVRVRYDGENRNPWNEFECGSNYSRSMASYALLPALSGFSFDMVNKHIGFAPVINQKNFSCFWCIDGAWGVYQRKGGRVLLTVEEGSLTLNSFSDSLFSDGKRVKVGKVSTISEKGMLRLSKPVTIASGRTLIIG